MTANAPFTSSSIGFRTWQDLVQHAAYLIWVEQLVVPMLTDKIIYNNKSKHKQNGKTSTFTRTINLAFANNNHPCSLGRSLEINCNVESRTKQSSCLVYLHCCYQHSRNFANHLYSYAQKKRIIIDGVDIVTTKKTLTLTIGLCKLVIQKNHK